MGNIDLFRTTIATSLLVLYGSLVCAEDSVREHLPDSDSRGRSTAIALNYCRASFHRIKRYPSKRVLIEEQENILNNLDLNGIADQEVIRLYSSVLDKIGHIQIAEQEKTILKQKYRQTFYRRLGTDVFVMGAQLATTHFAGALRTGINSWWDYREMGWQRDLDAWRVDKQQMIILVDKSSEFLDTFWKMAQKNNIPDRWLVRGSDLNRLEEAIREADPEVRMRVLKRMERFMECYPPYWYHVARTQQALGQLFAAANSYDHLADLAAGHFRKDDMLAAGLANRAAIQDYLRQAGSIRTAREALQFSTDVWEANLLCARVLERHGLLERAEDAILRNLDVDLEREQSAVALLGLYFRSNNDDQLTARMNASAFIKDVPVQVLVECATKFQDGELPDAAREQIAESLHAYLDGSIGRDHFVISAKPNWHLQNAQIALLLGGQRFERPQLTWSKGDLRVRFRDTLDLTNPFRPPLQPLSAQLEVVYPELQPMRVRLECESTRNSNSKLVQRENALQITAITFGNTQIPLRNLHETKNSQRQLTDTPRIPKDVDRPAVVNLQTAADAVETTDQQLPTPVDRLKSNENTAPAPPETTIAPVAPVAPVESETETRGPEKGVRNQ